MSAQKINLFVFSLLFYASTAFAQTDPPAGPPAMAMPDDNNTVLVDKIIEVTKHEKYFIDYCTKKVKDFAEENKWTAEKTTEILGSIKFTYYNSTIYNSYALYTAEQLKTLLKALTLLKMDKNTKLTMVLTNSMMQSNLDLYVKGVIEGKYMTNKKDELKATQ